MVSLHNRQSIKKFSPIKLAATFGLWAPGSPPNPERFKSGLQNIESLGYKTKSPMDPCVSYLSSRVDFASASIEDRITVFEELLKDPEVGAIIALRGAYGSAQLLPYIDFDLFKIYAKPVIGYSDITALLVGLYAKTGLPVIHGPTVSKEFAELNSSEATKESIDHLVRLLSDGRYRPELNCQIVRGAGLETMKQGARGHLVCGNLTGFLSLLGTPWDLSFDGAILVLEEINEAPYRIHRGLTQLKLAGKFEKLAGLIFGRFSECRAKNGPTIDEILTKGVLEIVKGTNFPILSGLEFGHNGKNLALPFGLEAEIQKIGEDSAVIRLLDSPVTI